MSGEFELLIRCQSWPPFPCVSEAAYSFVQPNYVAVLSERWGKIIYSLLYVWVSHQTWLDLTNWDLPPIRFAFFFEVQTLAKPVLLPWNLEQTKRVILWVLPVCSYWLVICVWNIVCVKMTRKRSLIVFPDFSDDLSSFPPHSALGIGISSSLRSCYWVAFPDKHRQGNILVLDFPPTEVDTLTLFCCCFIRIPNSWSSY